MIDLHYWPTPNGKKVTILLEELGLPYRIVPCNIGKGDQFTGRFLTIGPNNRMPAMVDHEPAGGGAPIAVFESGAIMMYLAEKAGQFYPQDARGKYEVTQWVIWQMANQGPKTGECGHFRRLGDTQRRPVLRRPPLHRRGQPALRRAQQPPLRPPLPGRRRVHDRRHDLAIPGPWTGKRQGQDIEEFKYFKRWFDELGARPAVQRGMAVTAGPAEDLASLTPEERERRMKLLFNQRARPAPVA